MEAPHLAQQLGRRLPSRLILEIDVSQFLAGASQADLTLPCSVSNFWNFGPEVRVARTGVDPSRH
jgi:hypothetical protein